MDKGVEAELSALVAKLSVSSPSFYAQQELLEFIRVKRLRESELVLKHGSMMIEKNAGKLGSEVWTMYERVFIAAIDCNDVNMQRKCLSALEYKFPTSVRVGILKGKKLEAEKNYSSALKLYNEILKDEPANKQAMKRKVCVRKAEGDLTQATKELSNYLKIFSSDENAWQELVDLYVETGKLDLAKFAAEELLLTTPENYLHHLQYAEIVYSLGGKSNHLLARQYYAQSLELKGEGNLRALYGLVMCLGGAGANPNKLSAQLFSWSVDRILSEYRNVASASAVASYTKAMDEKTVVGDFSVPKLDFVPSREEANLNPHLPHIVHASLVL